MSISNFIFLFSKEMIFCFIIRENQRFNITKIKPLCTLVTEFKSEKCKLDSKVVYNSARKPTNKEKVEEIFLGC